MLTVAERWLRQAQLTPAEAVCTQPLLIPLQLKVEGKRGAGRRSASAGAARIDVHTDALHVTVRASFTRPDNKFKS